MHSYNRARTALLSLLAVGILAGCSDEPTGPTTPHPSITTTELATGYVGEVYTAGVNATGGSGGYRWEVLSGALPPGLELSVEDLSDDDLLITGTPEAEGSYPFRLRLSTQDGRADTAAYRIEIVVPEPLGVETIQLAPALAGYPYAVQLRSTAVGTATWSLVAGTLPTGLALSSTGEISGVPVGADTAGVTIQVSDDRGTAVRDFTLVVHLDDPGRFNITALPVTRVPIPLRDNVEEALRRWEAALVGDLTRWEAPEGTFSEESCGGFGGMADGTVVDDVIMLINIDTIDGPGQVLGRAGPCYLRAAGGEVVIGDDLPIVGVLTLDQDDLLLIPSEETVTDIIQHEMGHILGLGPLWDRFNLLEAEGTADPRYSGESAIAAYQAAGGTAATIPVENQGGSGTADSHWRETVFDRELMTGFSEHTGVDMFLSEMTIAAYADMGYEVDLSVADEAPLLALMAPQAYGPGTDMGYDIVGVGPIVGITPDGTRAYTLVPPTREP